MAPAFAIGHRATHRSVWQPHQCDGEALLTMGSPAGERQAKWPPAALSLRFAWRAHLFERFLGLDLRLADLPASPQT